MDIKFVKVGNLKCNTYIISIDNYALIVDPGAEYDKIKELINNKEVLGILVTHHHYDHVLAISNCLRDYNVFVYENGTTEENKKYNVGPFAFSVIKTPGHSHDSISFYFEKEKVMFVGDFIFMGTIGRTDLSTSSDIDMQKSLRKISKYDDDIILYSGHGRSSILGDEKINNIYLKEVIINDNCN